MADDSDYMVPCPCGGYLHYIFDVEQPHVHHGAYASPSPKALVDDMLQFDSYEGRIARQAETPLFQKLAQTSLEHASGEVPSKGFFALQLALIRQKRARAKDVRINMGLMGATLKLRVDDDARWNEKDALIPMPIWRGKSIQLPRRFRKILAKRLHRLYASPYTVVPLEYPWTPLPKSDRKKSESDYDSLSKEDQALVRKHWSKTITKRRSKLNLAKDFTRAGRSWTEADASGAVVKKNDSKNTAN